MSHRRRLRLSALAMPLAMPLVALLVPATAHAEKVVTPDGVGDAHQVNWAETDATANPFIPAPAETSTDITRTVVAHGDHRLSITVHFRDLVRITDHSTYVRVLTPTQGRFDLSLVKEEGSRAEVSLTQVWQGPVECRGLRGSIEREADLVSVTLPTSCLGSPRWVQLGVAASAFQAPESAQDPWDFDLFADDGNRDTVRGDSIGKGPRIQRG